MKYFVYINDTIFGIRYKRNTGEVIIGTYNKYEEIVLSFLELFLGVTLQDEYEMDTLLPKVRIYKSDSGTFVERKQVQRNKFRYCFKYKLNLFISAMNKAADIHTVSKVNSLREIMR